VIGRALAVLAGAAGFFPWHFLLRRAGIRLPTRRSARLYAALAAPPVAARVAGPLLAVISAAASVWWLRRAFASRAESQDVHGARAHFDALAPQYAAQLAPAARERVVERKTALMASELAASGISAGT
jgi:hypothetical protein